MTAEEAGKQIDDALGLTPMKPKPEVAPDPPKAFPARALRDRPGEAPLIEQETE